MLRRLLPLQQTAVLSDGVVVMVLNNATPIDLLAQSAVLFFNSPTCPPETQRTYTSNPFIYQIYANHNLVGAKRLQLCKVSTCVGADLYICPNALCLYKQHIHPFHLW